MLRGVLLSPGWSGIAACCALGLALAQPATASYLQYVVQPGDNLWTISARYLERLSRVPALQRLNGIREPRRLMPGTVVRLPRAWIRRVSQEARLTDPRGEVEFLSADGRAQPAQPGLVLRVGDRVRTGRNSNVVLELPGSARVLLNPDSLVRLRAFARLGASEAMEALLDIERGSTENLVTPARDPASRFEIHTPSAIAAARGTDYRVGLLEQGRSRTEVLEGSVDLEGAGRSVSLQPGFGAIAQVAAGPGDAQPLPVPPDLSALPTLYSTLPFRIAYPPTLGIIAWRTQIAAATAPNRPLHDQVDSQAQALVRDLPDGAYVLRVRSQAESGLEGLEATARFVLDARPEPPFLMEPQPDAALLGAAEFRWAERVEQVRYRFQLSADPGFNRLLVDRDGIGQASISLEAALLPGSYHWRVAAVDASEGQGPFSDNQAFRILPPPPKPPETQPPEIAKDTLSLRWKSGAPGDRYEIQLARDAAFKELLVEQSLGEARLDLPRPEAGEYYLRARTLDSDGRAGPYSPTQRIVVPKPELPWWPALLLLLPFIL